MKLEDLEGKRWEELLLIQGKKTKEIHKKIKSMADQIEDLYYSLDLDDFENYLKALDNKIYFPRWNKFPQTTPDHLEIHVEQYYLFVEPDFFMQGIWRNGEFLTHNEYRENGKMWDREDNVSFWIPITYPTPY